MKNKSILIILIISIFLNALLIYFFLYRGENVTTAPDNRIVIKMSGQNREHIMSEMRTFLESVRDIQEGIIKNNPELIIQVSNESGNCRAEHVPKGLIRTLPLGFKTLGMNTHDLFDEIARNTKENYNKEETEKKLSQILTNCITCHKSYKIAEY